MKPIDENDDDLEITLTVVVKLGGFDDDVKLLHGARSGWIGSTAGRTSSLSDEKWTASESSYPLP